MDITRIAQRTLQCRYGASNGLDHEAGEELRRRGLNSKQLGELIWEYGQTKWRTEATATPLPPTVLGTCSYRGTKIVIREGSQELKSLLGAVNVKGLPDDSGYRFVRGELVAMVNAEHDRLLELLPESEVMTLCQQRGLFRKCAVRKELARRIWNQHSHQLGKLVRHAATHPCRKELFWLVEAALAPAIEVVSKYSDDELRALFHSSDHLLAYAARRKWGQQRKQNKILRHVDSMKIGEVIATHNRYRRKGIPELQERLVCRLKDETIGWEEVVSMLPMRGCNQRADFLRDLGLAAVGFATLPGEPRTERWDRAAVLAALTHHPAHLYKRARNEYRGRLPDDLHARMLLDTGPFVKKYVEFLITQEAKLTSPA